MTHRCLILVTCLVVSACAYTNPAAPSPLAAVVEAASPTPEPAPMPSPTPIPAPRPAPVAAAPLVCAIPSPATAAPNVVVTLRASGGDGSVNGYHWDFSPGNVQSGAVTALLTFDSVSVYWTTTGVKTVTLSDKVSTITCGTITVS